MVLERWFTHLDVFIKFPFRAREHSPNRRFEDAHLSYVGWNLSNKSSALIFQSASRCGSDSREIPHWCENKSTHEVKIIKSRPLERIRLFRFDWEIEFGSRATFKACLIHLLPHNLGFVCRPESEREKTYLLAHRTREKRMHAGNNSRSIFLVDWIITSLSL